METVIKYGIIVCAAAVAAAVDIAIGIEWGQYPWWKQLAHKTAYILFGAIIALL